MTTHDKVITSLKAGQESIYVRMTTATDNVQKKMDTMNNSLQNLQQSLFRLVGVPEADIARTHCVMANTTHDSSSLGTQPVLLGGLGN